jgi:hypothetical protein
MTDYYSALKKAIERVDQDSAEARRKFYDNARDVLNQGVNASDPPPAASEVSRQRQELEDAIRRLERELAVSAEDIGRRRPQGRAETGQSGVAQRRAPRSDKDRLRSFAAPASDPDGDLRRRQRWSDDSNETEASRRSPVPAILLVALIVGAAVGLGLLAWSQRSVIADLFPASDSGPTEVAAPEPAPPPPPDTASATPPETASPPTAETAGPRPADATAQPPPVVEGAAAGGPKAMLIEAQPRDVAVNAGDTVIPATIDWQFVEDATDGPEIRADLDVPGRGMKVSVVIRRNTDPDLPASHLIEVTTTTPADFPGKGIRSVPGLALKPGEKDPGEPLAAAAVTVTDGVFWVAPYTTEPEVTRNLWLLKERPWIDLPMVYESGQRAILSFEKGEEGSEAFNRAFAAWEAG